MKRRVFFEWGFVVVVYLFYVWVHFRNLKFFDKDNVFSSYDGYWYGRLAKNIFEGLYTGIDYLTNVPDYAYIPVTPMISLMAAYLSKVLNIPIEQIFLYMPVLLGGLFIIPMYLWIRKYLPFFVFVGGALIGLFNTIYYYRTGVGRFDTDSLILFFIFLIFIFLTEAIKNKEKSYLNLIIAGILFNLFMWWYYKPVLLLFFVSSLFLGLLAEKYQIKDIAKKVLFFLVIISPFYLKPALYSVFHYLYGYILKQPSGIIPFSITGSIQELQPVSFDLFVYYLTDNIGVVLIGFIGLVLLLIFHFRVMIVALPFIVLGLLSFKAGSRFLMYFAPFLGMGVGYFVFVMNRYLNERMIKTGLLKIVLSVSMLVFLIFVSVNSNIVDTKVKPIFTDRLYETLGRVPIEKDSYVWTWWDYGNLIEYRLGLGTFIDNHSFNQIKIYFYAHSMLLSDSTKAKNMISFLTNNLYKNYGLNIKTAEDSQKLKDRAINYNAFPQKRVYVFTFPVDIHKDIIFKIGAWGNKDYQTFSLKRAFFKCIEEKDVYNCGRYKFDKRFVLFYPDDENFYKSNPYREVRFVEIKPYEKNYYSVLYSSSNPKKNLFMEFIKYKGEMYLLMMDYRFKDSLFHRMMIFDKDLKDFEPVYVDFPLITVYSVK
ncbi:hypothetical protein GWK41_05090 [Persephonella atlantica]|uniref:Oligosaccharyl transferase STT3 subunit n=1 Tax=Persephonella atlantica TaxID=2699429 RepID=A0ABS1GHT5_9AQUI|nr:STT3 domain-containing protein [Persephonella atlantica]MBK3332435.1 hypothetical protein [Persephonella atlantica]